LGHITLHPSDSLLHCRHFIVADVGTCAGKRDQAHLVKDVQAVQVVLMDHYLQILTVLLKINSFEFPCLIVSADVIIEGEVTKTSE
jgi:hypothetical protein